ncbi:hypothetical protein BG006_002600 [Podila minutissima]|uniref:Uncharacterized protein n=1 Tax=Podila minutissima TaxID=64525 RepID=A0A9P5VNM0_9FUNG|nr:hypothetical protein BG006_002600 [Podila minutissima]
MLLQQIPQQQQQWQMSQSQYEQQIQQMHHAQLLQQQQQQQYLQQQQQQQPTSSPLIRKRGLVNESDEFMGIKKRNLGSEATAQGMFGYPEIGADSPGSIMSNRSNSEAQSYFEQPHYQTSSSSSAQGPTSAPSTPAISITQSSGSSQAHGWGSFGQGGSHSSPPTPQGSFGAHTASSNMFASALSEQGSVEYRMQQEKQQLQEAQQQEQQRLQEAQQMEIQAMQRQQEEHAKAQAASKSAVHHDHNDPATWGYGNSPSQFTGYLGGYGRGYTPAAIGGVAALAAASAMAASRQRTTSSGSGMDMDM